MSVSLSIRLSVCLSVRLKLKILVTTEPIGFYSSGNISTGPVVILGYFLGEWDTPNPPKNEKIPPIFFFFIFKKNFLVGGSHQVLIALHSGWFRLSHGMVLDYFLLSFPL